MTINKLLAAGAALLCIVATAGSVQSAPSGVTVGQFATQVVSAIGRDAHDIAAVRASLRSMGVNPEFDAAAPLTAGIVEQIARELGVRVTAPASPATPVTTGQAASLAGRIGGVYIDRSAAGIEDPPDQCLTSATRGECVNCCKEAAGLTGQFCGRFCHANVPPPVSPEEPQP